MLSPIVLVGVLALCVFGCVLVVVGIRQTARRLGRAVLADLVGWGLVGLVGAWFAGHR